MCETGSIIMTNNTKPIIVISTYLNLSYNVVFNKATVVKLSNERYVSQFDQFTRNSKSFPKHVWKGCLVANANECI